MAPAFGDLGRGKTEAGPDLVLTQGVLPAQVLRSLASGQSPGDHIHWHAGALYDRLPTPHGRIDRDVFLPAHALHPQPLYVCRQWRRGGGSNRVAHRWDAPPLVRIFREAPPHEEVTRLSALLAREVTPSYHAVAFHTGRRRGGARPRTLPAPATIAIPWLSARGVHDAVPVPTAHPTALTAGAHFRRTGAYRFVLCHRDGHLLRAVETPFRIDGVVLLRRTRLGGPWQAAASPGHVRACHAGDARRGGRPTRRAAEQPGVHAQGGAVRMRGIMGKEARTADGGIGSDVRGGEEALAQPVLSAQKGGGRQPGARHPPRSPPALIVVPTEPAHMIHWRQGRRSAPTGLGRATSISEADGRCA